MVTNSKSPQFRLIVTVALVTFPPTTYSITFFLFPPLGATPRQPPKPFFALRTPSIQPDSYLIGSNRDHLDYRIWDHSSGTLRPDLTQKVTGTFTLQEVP